MPYELLIRIYNMYVHLSPVSCARSLVEKFNNADMTTTTTKKNLKKEEEEETIKQLTFCKHLQGIEGDQEHTYARTQNETTTTTTKRRGRIMCNEASWFLNATYLYI